MQIHTEFCGIPEKICYKNTVKFRGIPCVFKKFRIPPEVEKHFRGHPTPFKLPAVWTFWVYPLLSSAVWTCSVYPFPLPTVWTCSVYSSPLLALWMCRIYLSHLSLFLNAGMPDCPASDQSGPEWTKIPTPEPFRYRNKGAQSGTIMLWYQLRDQMLECWCRCPAMVLR